MIARIVFVAGLFLLSACTARGPLAMVPDGTPPGESVVVFQASNRAYGSLQPPRRGRVPVNDYDRFVIRVPEVRDPGDVAIPDGAPRPDRHFLVADATDLGDAAGLTRALRRELSLRPAGDREISVFVPGYNMSAAQSLARTAQLSHDLGIPGITALYSWPSAASVLGYAYDRDSTLYSRDGYESFLRAVAQSRPERLLLVAHSMGALLTMETLRQIEISDPGWTRRNLGGVVLISPDIDLDVFRSQVARIGDLPQPFVIFVSEKDRVLTLSAQVAGDGARLGTVTDPAVVADLDLTLIDISRFSSGVGHFDFGRSPALLSIIGQMARVELSFENDPAARSGLVVGTLLTVQNATRIVLSPAIQ